MSNKTKKILGATGCLVGGFYVFRGVSNRKPPPLVLGAIIGGMGLRALRNASASDTNKESE